MKKNIYDKITTIYLIVLIMGLFISSIIYVYELTNCDTIAFMLYVFGGIGLILYLYHVIISKNIRFWDLLVILIYFFCYLSYLNAYNQETALYGYFSGREGMLVIYTYYIIFLLVSTLKNDKFKKIILLLITCQGIMQVIYCLLQVTRLYYVFKMPIMNPGRYSTGLFSNSNFFGSYISLIVGLWIPNYFFNEKFDIKSYLVLSFLIVGLLSCGTMSALVALIAIIFLAIIYYFIKRKSIQGKRFLIKLVTLVVTICVQFMALTYFTGSSLVKDTVQLKDEIISVASGEVDDYFGTGRIYIWKQTLKYVPKYFWYGIGIDNYTYLGFADGTFIYDSPLEDNIINKAHNEYLHILATGGIFLFIVYMVLIISIFVKASKDIIKSNKRNSLRDSFFFAFCSYLVQAFFNCRMIFIAPFFFIIMGLLVSTIEKEIK